MCNFAMEVFNNLINNYLCHKMHNVCCFPLKNKMAPLRLAQGKYVNLHFTSQQVKHPLESA